MDPMIGVIKANALREKREELREIASKMRTPFDELLTDFQELQIEAVGQLEEVHFSYTGIQIGGLNQGQDVGFWPPCRMRS